MRLHSRTRDERGSIALTAMVSVITVALTAALLTTVYRDIRVSRRAGDAANALQVADAGLNDAVKALRNAVAVAGGCPSLGSSTTAMAFSRTNTLAGGTYTYCAFPDTDTTGRPVWHIDTTATDATGVQRRLRADAVAEPMFPNAINVIASGDFESGFSVDSFKSETERCTRKGKIGTNNPQSFSFGNNGNSTNNCQNVPNGAFPHPPDGCIAYSINGDVPIPNSATGTGRCPSAYTSMTADPFPTPDVTLSGQTVHYQGNDFTCDGPGELEAGKLYYFTSVTLAENCSFAVNGPWPTMANPTRIYVRGNLTIAGGNGQGNDHPINKPPNNATVCGSSHLLSGADPWYCPGWAGALQINVQGEYVDFTGNHSTFWGVVRAPNSTIRWRGGASQWEIFGSTVANSFLGAVQAEWHYDENLGALTTGRYFARNWREEPLRP